MDRPTKYAPSKIVNFELFAAIIQEQLFDDNDVALEVGGIFYLKPDPMNASMAWVDTREGAFTIYANPGWAHDQGNTDLGIVLEISVMDAEDNCIWTESLPWKINDSAPPAMIVDYYYAKVLVWYVERMKAVMDLYSAKDALSGEKLRLPASA